MTVNKDRVKQPIYTVVFWDMTSYNLVDSCQGLGETNLFHSRRWRQRVP
jgi:hypothetical protein